MFPLGFPVPCKWTSEFPFVHNLKEKRALDIQIYCDIYVVVVVRVRECVTVFNCVVFLH